MAQPVQPEFRRPVSTQERQYPSQFHLATVLHVALLGQNQVEKLCRLREPSTVHCRLVSRLSTGKLSGVTGNKRFDLEPSNRGWRRWLPGQHRRLGWRVLGWFQIKSL